MRCRAKLRGILAAVSPLAASSHQGAKAGGALCLPPCPLRLPLLFPKNLAPLRFSGALFIDRVEKSCAQAYQQTNAFPFHAFTLFKGEGGTSRFCGA